MSVLMWGASVLPNERRNNHVFLHHCRVRDKPGPAHFKVTVIQWCVWVCVWCCSFVIWSGGVTASNPKVMFWKKSLHDQNAAARSELCAQYVSISALLVYQLSACCTKRNVKMGNEENGKREKKKSMQAALKSHSSIPHHAPNRYEKNDSFCI